MSQPSPGEAGQWKDLSDHIRERIIDLYGSETAAAKELAYWDQATINRTLKIKEDDVSPAKIRNLRLLAFDVGLTASAEASREEEALWEASQKPLFVVRDGATGSVWFVVDNPENSPLRVINPVEVVAQTEANVSRGLAPGTQPS